MPDGFQVISFIQSEVDLLKEANQALDRGALLATNFADSVFDRLALNETTHYVTLVGRQWNETNLSCEYIFRNSWGADWMTRKAIPSWIIPDSKRPGDFRMSESAVRDNILGLTFLAK